MNGSARPGVVSAAGVNGGVAAVMRMQWCACSGAHAVVRMQWCACSGGREVRVFQTSEAGAASYRGGVRQLIDWLRSSILQEHPRRGRAHRPCYPCPRVLYSTTLYSIPLVVVHSCACRTHQGRASCCCWASKRVLDDGAERALQ